MPRPIAVLGGTGPEGFGLALRWARAGETVIIGSRDSQRAQNAAAEIKEKVGAHAQVFGDENTAVFKTTGVQRTRRCSTAIRGIRLSESDHSFIRSLEGC